MSDELRRNLQINGVTYHLAVNQYGSGAPMAATPGKPAVLYMNTDTGELYKCTAADVERGIYTWEPLAGSDSSQNGGGLSDTGKTLLITILRNGVYSSDQSANITALEAALASSDESSGGNGGDSGDSGSSGDSGDSGSSGETVTYTIANILSNVTSSNSATNMTGNSAYAATLTAADGCKLSTVTVLMGGVDVTADVYADGVISIAAVTGNVVITATAVKTASNAQYFELVQGQLGNTSNLSVSSSRVSYNGYDVVLAPGVIYRLVGVNGVRYGVQQVTADGVEVLQSGGAVSTTQKIDSGWQSTGYEFTAIDHAAVCWLTASRSSGDITPEEAMPVWIEEV